MGHQRNIWFTADQHFGHKNIITYCNRPFLTLSEMEEEIIYRHNKVVSSGDNVIHLGDFSFYTKELTKNIISRLNGNHTFLKGDHDKKWLGGNPELKEFKIGDWYVECFHWPMLSWPRAFHGSIHLFAHSHGQRKHPGAAMDVGVDTNDFYPYLWDEIIRMLKGD